MKRIKRSTIEKNLEIIAKKLNIFTIEDAEVLLEKSRIEIIPELEKLVSRNKLKQEDETYIYIPRKVKKTNNVIPLFDDKTIIEYLPFKVKKPKEVHVRNINNMDGFVDYFFATQATKDRIHEMFKVFKAAEGKSGEKLEKVLKKHNYTIQKYLKLKNEVARNGLVNLVGTSTNEPGEIFYFYKTYFLSPKKLSSQEAWELAIQRFEKLIKMRLNRSKITRPSTMYKWMRQEYSLEEIHKYRNYNFSKFNTDNIFEG